MLANVSLDKARNVIQAPRRVRELDKFPRHRDLAHDRFGGVMPPRFVRIAAFEIRAELAPVRDDSRAEAQARAVVMRKRCGHLSLPRC